MIRPTLPWAIACDGPECLSILTMGSLELIGFDRFEIGPDGQRLQPLVPKALPPSWLTVSTSGGRHHYCSDECAAIGRKVES